MIHNMWFNTTTGKKKSYYKTLHEEEWWDNGTLPIWITAQRQVGAPFHPVTGEITVVTVLWDSGNQRRSHRVTTQD